jgi:hypothetical protein
MKAAFRCFPYYFLFLILFITAACFPVSAQESPTYQAVSQKLDARRKHKGTTRLFLHLDKSIYVHNENIWFSGYVLQSAAPLKAHHTLFVLLSRQDTKQVVLEQRFVMEDGLSSGSLFLPDTLQPATYDLIAYTNQFPEDGEKAPFQQELRLASALPDPFLLRFRGLFPSPEGSTLLFGLEGDKEVLAQKRPLAYTLLADKKKVLSGSARLSAAGELSVPVNPRDLEGKHTELLVEATLEEGLFIRSFPFLVDPGLLTLSWYPEGGELVEGLRSRVSFEARRGDGSPVEERFLLLDGQQPVDTLHTAASGIGIFYLTPLPGHRYSIQPVNPSVRVVTEHLPTIRPGGLSLHLPQATVKDKLTIQVTSPTANFRMGLLIHDNYQDLFYEEYGVRSNGLTLNIPTTELKPGRLTLVLFDSLGREAASREVFVEPALPVVSIEADSARYRPRSKVGLRVKVTDAEGKPLRGLFSLSVVLSRRIDTARFQDIVPFYYFNPPAYSRQARGFPYRLGNSSEIETYLLTRAWSGAAWQALDTARPAAGHQSATSFIGSVRYRNETLNKPVQLSILSGTQIHSLKTDKRGQFELAPEMIAAPHEEQPIVTLTGVYSTTGYTITMEPVDVPLKKALAGQAYPPFVSFRPPIPPEKESADPSINPLANVVVRSTVRPDEYLVGPGSYHRPNCEDYVCIMNILNCINHPTSTQKPQNGITYSYRLPDNKIVKVLYESCTTSNPNYFRIPGRYYSKEFYRADYASFNPPLPEINSTIHWETGVVTDEKGEALIQFYTNDLTGRLSCVLQGISDKGVISGKQWIMVVR